MDKVEVMNEYDKVDWLICQLKIAQKERDEALAKLSELVDLCYFADFSNGVGDFGADEGRIMAHQTLTEMSEFLKRMGHE